MDAQTGITIATQQLLRSDMEEPCTVTSFITPSWITTAPTTTQSLELLNIFNQQFVPKLVMKWRQVSPIMISTICISMLQLIQLILVPLNHLANLFGDNLTENKGRENNAKESRKASLENSTFKAGLIELT